LNPFFFRGRFHSGEAAIAGEDGANRAVIKGLRGGRGGGKRVFAASLLHGAAREQYAAMEAGGGAVEAPPQKRGSSKTGQPRPPRQKIGPDLLSTILFFSLFSYFVFHIKRVFFPKKGSARST
jgi:hypothetical protein